jgi:hypothetical protein
MLAHKELALVLVLFWVGCMGLTDKSVDAKVSIGKVPRGERKSFWFLPTQLRLTSSYDL